MKKTVELSSFLVHTQKFSRNMHPSKNVHTKKSDNLYEQATQKRLQRDQS